MLRQGCDLGPFRYVRHVVLHIYVHFGDIFGIFLRVCVLVWQSIVGIFAHFLSVLESRFGQLVQGQDHTDGKVKISKDCTRGLFQVRKEIKTYATVRF